MYSRATGGWGLGNTLHEVDWAELEPGWTGLDWTGLDGLAVTRRGLNELDLNALTMTKSDMYHQVGASLYLRISFICISGFSVVLFLYCL